MQSGADCQANCPTSQLPDYIQKIVAQIYTSRDISSVPSSAYPVVMPTPIIAHVLCCQRCGRHGQDVVVSARHLCKDDLRLHGRHNRDSWAGCVCVEIGPDEAIWVLLGVYLQKSMLSAGLPSKSLA